MKAAIIVSPGSNCDRDVQVALEQNIASPPIMHWHRDPDLPKVDLIVIPGGFSYGDYLRAGAMAAHSPVIREVIDRAQKGVPVLGICNGFQILTECHLLPGTFMKNSGLRFICRDVGIRVENNTSIFTRNYAKGQKIKMPIAHNEGNYFADPETLSHIIDNDLVALKYCSDDGEVSEAANPNGALLNIAGVLNEKRNVLGMMPHPERCSDKHLGGEDGRTLFSGLADAIMHP